VYRCYPRDPWLILLRREGGDDFLEAPVAAQRVPKWQQLQLTIAWRHGITKGTSKLFTSHIFITSPRGDHGEILNHRHASDCVFLRRKKLNCPPTFLKRFFFSS